jgi:hypothetical protein
MPPRSRPNYDLKLTRAIVLKDGKRLVTLQDAADVVLDLFGSVNARGGHVDATIERLIAAAESGKCTDVRERANYVGGNKMLITVSMTAPAITTTPAR